MTGRLFGTDGVRGLANRDLTVELALQLATAAAQVLNNPDNGRQRPLAIVGNDSRASADFLEAAVIAGLTSSGVDVLRVGILPTPGVAHFVATLNADFGVMLSASHNPMPDNGIKFFARGGHKLSDEVEDAIEAKMGKSRERPIGDKVGRVSIETDAVQKYADYLVSTIPRPLTGLRVVVDCANGAASEVAPLALKNAGANVIAINHTPSGYNINRNCGSTHMESLIQAVLTYKADVGIAHDGDADRCLAVDADGNIVDGDQLLAILALSKASRGQLPHNTVVSTVMSNLGFKKTMADAGIALRETDVGDRYVLKEMQAGGYVLGGEQSGHIIMSEYGTTGDGILTALHVLAGMTPGHNLAYLASAVTKFPQILINVKGVDKNSLHGNQSVAAAVARAEKRLGDAGRVLLRSSGTEPVIRVMVEADTVERAETTAAKLASVVQKELTLA